MYMMSSLIQSTRHHYESSLATAKVGKVAISNSSSSNADLPTTKQNKSMYTQNLTNEQLGEDNEDNSESDGLSSWTPSQSSFSRLNYHERKNIDNDNRSDGQSSFMPGGGEEESSRTSSYSDSNASSSENGDDDVGDSQMKAYEGEQMKRSKYSDIKRPYAIIG